MHSIFRPTILLALTLMAIIVMMVLPVPAWILDVGLAVSFALAILIFTVTLFIERPLEFSAFPTVLLASLMLRLSLNVSSTKLIIGEGHTGTGAAGDVIEGFAMFVMSGSVLLGLVVFCVLLIVNFVVITKGAARMAEVGARFALDGMPGKQLAIDSDVAAGSIDHAEAKARREREQAETTFFGSLDGASKFVKGDAIAGLLITLLNLVMGLVIGTLVHGMPLGRAFETYAILTVGDGLVSQIPAVVISIASALLLARGGATGSTDLALFTQLGRFPAALGTVAMLMALFALVPGMPFVPFIIGAAALGAASWYGVRHPRPVEDLEEGGEATNEAALPDAPIGDLLDIDDIHVKFAPDLVQMVLDPATGLDARIENMRRHIASEFGLVLPEMRLTDDATLPPGTYTIGIQGVETARDRLEPDRLLALLGAGEDSTLTPDLVKEPVYGAPARWVSAGHEDQLALDGATIVTPVEVLATHLLEVLKHNLGRLFGLKTLRRLLDEVSNFSNPGRAEANRQLIEELVPEKVPVDLLVSVLRLLLEERVSIRNLPLILEAVAEGRTSHSSPEAVCEHVRQRLGFQIIADLRRADGMVPLLQLDPAWEVQFAEHEVRHETGPADVALPPDAFNRLVQTVGDKLSKTAEAGEYPGIVTTMKRRRFLRTVLATKGIRNPVLSYEELGTEAKPTLLGVIAA